MSRQCEAEDPAVIKDDEDDRQRPKQIQAGLPLPIGESRIKGYRFGLNNVRRRFGVQKNWELLSSPAEIPIRDGIR
jgi:hypothetical protein